jgi:hypothetical protein
MRRRPLTLPLYCKAMRRLYDLRRPPGSDVEAEIDRVTRSGLLDDIVRPFPERSAPLDVRQGSDLELVCPIAWMGRIFPLTGLEELEAAFPEPDRPVGRKRGP